MTSESEMTKTRLLERIQTGWEELMDVLLSLIHISEPTRPY